MNESVTSDEIHLLLECEKVVDERKYLCDVIKKNLIKTFTTHNDEQKFIYIVF